ncbi:Mitochondrial import inner membrane translocase subunit Tim21 [Hondaea fermentalgiana]|uniref:Mitochondrial import inner membrane translocase subunit Tim21 n=1 Tax=Hondaea fermentalgiana TaxID=2315210 RepID=A0A2R5GYK3_9STRA|nr:Mitochondrial import inner membrane translocase subunit Tim21 [Hondaea fermentalgiana]|eukprot:GBG33813.1 Mitochondrial import inner membrane translocase subunit Tim21 [Hondaea fermentalgiana]
MRQQKRGLNTEKPQQQGRGSVQETSDAPPPTTIRYEQGAVRTAASGFVWLGVAALVAVSGYYIVSELMPTKMSPNSVFNSAFEEIRNKPEVVSRLGDNIRAYGTEYSRRKEGRRNHIEHQVYRDIDGVKRIRVQFNIEGSRSKAAVYAEVAENMDNGEFSYIIIEQALQGGQRQAIALVDNRPIYSPGEVQEKVAERLNAHNSVLYGHSSCQWTQRQLLEFGEYADKLKVVLCDKPENKDQCEKANLPGYPCWTIAGQQLPSFHSIEELRTMVQFHLP